MAFSATRQLSAKNELSLLSKKKPFGLSCAEQSGDAAEHTEGGGGENERAQEENVYFKFCDHGSLALRKAVLKQVHQIFCASAAVHMYAVGDTEHARVFFCSNSIKRAVWREGKSGA